MFMLMFQLLMQVSRYPLTVRIWCSAQWENNFLVCIWRKGFPQSQTPYHTLGLDLPCSPEKLNGKFNGHKYCTWLGIYWKEGFMSKAFVFFEGIEAGSKKYSMIIRVIQTILWNLYLNYWSIAWGLFFWTPLPSISIIIKFSKPPTTPPFVRTTNFSFLDSLISSGATIVHISNFL